MSFYVCSSARHVGAQQINAVNGQRSRVAVCSKTWASNAAKTRVADKLLDVRPGRQPPPKKRQLVLIAWDLNLLFLLCSIYEKLAFIL